MASVSCGKKFGNTSFDLSRLTIQSQLPYYTIHDNSAGNYTYYFNVCGHVKEAPCKINVQQTGAKGACIGKAVKNDSTNSWDCSNIQPISGTGTAWQFKYSDKRCYHVGGSPEQSTWKLMDASDPSRGVTHVFDKGDFCTQVGINRRLELSFRCADKAHNVPDTEIATEGPPCVYKLEIASIHGCPTECGVINNKLCNRAGLCDFDVSSNSSKCFCYHGMSGRACETGQPKMLTPPPSKPVSTCGWQTTWKGVQVSFELKSFGLKDLKKKSWFKVHDAAIGESKHYDYYFSVCDPIQKPYPPNCTTVDGPCKTAPCTNGTGLEKITKPMGFQTERTAGSCFLLGQSTKKEFSLLDDTDPTRGVVLRYSDGGWCSQFKRNRIFEIRFVCPDSRRDFFDPSKSRIINESIPMSEDKGDNSCMYNLTYKTAYACPSQCTLTMKNGALTVCSGKGICAADPIAKRVRCLCDDGWDGPQCNQKATLPPTPGNPVAPSPADQSLNPGVIAAIIILAVLLVVCGAGLYYMKKERDDISKKLMLLDAEYSPDDDIPDAGTVGFATDDVQIRDLDEDDDEL